MDIVSYHQEIRTALFLSSVTLGTFLFTMKSFIIQTMKKEVYDNEIYQKSVLSLQELTGPQHPYAPLKKLANLLKWSIWLSLASALLQITVGVIGHSLSAIVCLLSAGLAWVFVGTSIYHVSDNLSKMIHFSEAGLKVREREKEKEREKFDN